MTHDCAADGHRWGVRRGADALSGRWFWTCIECGHVDLGRPVSWPQILVRRLTAAIKATPE